MTTTHDDDNDELDDATTAAGGTPVCERCGKPAAFCVCDRVEPIARPRTEVLILQHPREPDKLLGTARLTELMVPSAHVRVGLSWASLAHALDREGVDPADWAVLYMGSLKKPLTDAQAKKEVVVLDRNGDERDVRKKPLAGIVVLDGTWSQAKSLWWRNPWMLKLGRLVLHPSEPSAYGRLRKEPRRECLSTIESVGEALSGLGEGDEARKKLRSVFRTLTQRARDAQQGEASERPKRGGARKGGGARRRKGSGGSRGGGPMD